MYIHPWHNCHVCGKRKIQASVREGSVPWNFQGPSMFQVVALLLGKTNFLEHNNQWNIIGKKVRDLRQKITRYGTKDVDVIVQKEGRYLLQKDNHKSRFIVLRLWFMALPRPLLTGGKNVTCGVLLLMRTSIPYSSAQVSYIQKRSTCYE